MFALIIEAIDAGNAATFLLAAQQMNLSRELLLVTKQQSQDFQSVFAWQGTVSEGNREINNSNEPCLLAPRPPANTLFLSGYMVYPSYPKNTQNFKNCGCTPPSCWPVLPHRNRNNCHPVTSTHIVAQEKVRRGAGLTTGVEHVV